MNRIIVILTSPLEGGLARGNRPWAFAAIIAAYFFISPATASAHITSLVPSSVRAGGPDFTLRLLGTDFDASDTSRVLFNGTRVAATLISSVELRATIPASLIVNPGVVRVTLEGFNSVDFTINSSSDCSYLMSVGQGANQLISQIFPSDGGSGTINITAISGCEWGALLLQGDQFVSLTSASSESGAGLQSPRTATGSGPGTLTYSVTRSSGSGRRSAIVQLYRKDFSGQLDAEPFTVIQEGTHCPASAYSISPLNTVRGYDAGSDSFQITAPRDCAWTATSEQRWIDVRTYTGFGNATVQFDVRSYEGPGRSGIINVGGKEFYVFQIPSDCFIRTLCAYFPSACRELGEGALAAARRFRDDVLAKTHRGQRYTQLYYKFSTEAVGILLLNPTLILRSQDLLQRYKPVLDSIVRGEQATLTLGDIEEIEGFLKFFETRGSSELRGAINGLTEDLRNPHLYAEFNITVTDGPKRDLPEKGIVQTVKRTSMMTAPIGLLLSFFCATRRRRKSARAALRRLLSIAIVFSVVQNSGQGSVVSGQWPVVIGEVKKSSESLPFTFESNQGQIDPQVKFIARGQGYSLYLTPSEAVMSIGRKKEKGKSQKWEWTQLTPDQRQQTTDHRQQTADHGQLTADQRQQTADPGQLTTDPRLLTPDVLRMKMVDGNNGAKIVGIDEVPGKSSYYIGRDPSRWRPDVRAYSKVKYESIYPGVDMVYYGKEGELEYDFIVAPGADPARITIGFEGAEEIEIDGKGDLVLEVGDGEVRQRKPVVYQEVNGARREIPGRHVLIRNPQSPNHSLRIGFEVGAYDRSRPLIIDPVLAYSTYFGGGGNEEGNSIAVDSAGNVYVTGFTDSMNFPLTNAVQANLGGGQQDAFVVKLDPSGTRAVYSTYIGGNGQDNGTSIAVDMAGNAYITGFTDSTNFPVRNALQATKRGTFNAFVTKLDPTGSIISSTLFGGNVSDYGSSIGVDSSGNIYVAGVATSPDLATAGAVQRELGGFVDIYVAKINPSGSGLVYSTYLGGVGIDGASSIAVDSAGNVYVTGLTSSPNFRTVNALQPAHGGGMFDAFVAKLNATGSEVVYSTYLGGGGEDRAFRVTVDSSRNAYVTGDTDSTNFPLVNAAQTSSGGSADAFVAKLSPAGNQLVYSTYLGGSGIDGGTAIAVDPSGSAYVTGFTASLNFPTAEAVQQVFGGGYDGFIAKLSSSGSAIVYSTYLGGSGIDSAFGVAADSTTAYVMGVTDSVNFPVHTPLQTTNGGGTADLFIAKITSGPTITGAMVDGKKLFVFGSAFDNKAKILINGQEQKSANDDQNPAGALIGKKAGKKIKRGQTATLQVRNSDGTLSNEFVFTRP